MPYFTKISSIMLRSYCRENDVASGGSGGRVAEDISYVFAVAAGVAPGALHTGNSRVSNLTGHAGNAGWTLQENDHMFATESTSAGKTVEPCV